MSANMEVVAPTFHALNKPQKRALLLRDMLRYTEPRHLDTFIEGIVDDEPPTYKRINGTVYPPLVFVALKGSAKRFDLGNVRFDNDREVGSGIYRAYLTIEGEALQLRTEEALPADEANLDSVPIHNFIAKTMVPMFEAKFKAIWARKNQINEIRQVAFNMSTQPAEEFHAGETLARLDSEQLSQNGSASQDKKSKERQPGQSIFKHVSNKRHRIGLDTIPQEAKSATFNAIPNQIKADLFNSVINTAFPNFDNLMTASWNVVSIYSNVGTDFPELHKSIVELKSVLQDFEESFGTQVTREEPKFRLDFAPRDVVEDADDGRSEQPEPDASQESTSNSAVDSDGDTDMQSQQREESDSLFVGPGPEQEPEYEHDEMPPPRSKPASRRGPTNEAEPILPTPRPNSIARPSSARSTSTSRKPARAPSIESLSSSTHSHIASPELLRRREEYQRSTSTLNRTASESEEPRTFADLSTVELRAKYKARKTQLIQTFGGNANVPQQYRTQMHNMMKEIKIREMDEGGDEGDAEDGGSAPTSGFLGNSMLGQKKSIGMAPIALMSHVKKESGGGGGAGGAKKD